MPAPRRGSDSITFHPRFFTTLPASSCRLAAGETPAGSVPSTYTASPAPGLFSSFKFNPDAPVFVPRSKEKEKQEKEELEKEGGGVGNSELDRSKAEAKSKQQGAEAEAEYKQQGAEAEAEKGAESEPELLIVGQAAKQQEGARAETELLSVAEKEAAEAEPEAAKQERAQAEAETKEEDREVEKGPAKRDKEPSEEAEAEQVDQSPTNDDEAEVAACYDEPEMVADLSTPSLLAREHPSRVVVVSCLPVDITKEALIGFFSAWGPVRFTDDRRISSGVAMVHYFDIRCALQAVEDIQQKHICFQRFRRLSFFHRHLQWLIEEPSSSSVAVGGAVYGLRAEWLEKQQFELAEADQQLAEVKRALAVNGGRGLFKQNPLWAHLVSPFLDVDGNEVGPSLYPEQENQGTLVVFNLKPGLDIKAAFAAYGDIREIRESPVKRTHKFVEYNDVRDAAQALAELNDTEIQGCRVKIEFSKPGAAASQRRCYWHMQPTPLEFPTVDSLWAGSPVTCVPNVCYYDYWGNVYAPLVDQAFTSQYAVEGHGEDQGSEDTRTTLMIRNIPNKYNQEKLIEIIDKYCREQNEGVTEPNQITAYDSIYVPIDHTNNCNKGYAFVNFCSVEARKKFQIAFEGYQWEECSRKTCHINFAKMQIRPGEIIPKMTTFQPPRDGRTAQQ